MSIELGLGKCLRCNIVGTSSLDYIPRTLLQVLFSGKNRLDDDACYLRDVKLKFSRVGTPY